MRTSFQSNQPTCTMKRPSSSACRTVARRRGAARGFTLIELLVVLAILVIGTGIAAPQMTKMMGSNRIQTEASALQGDMQFARTEAIKRGSWVSLCPSSDGLTCVTANTWHSGWIVFADANGNGVYDSATDPAILKVRGATKGGDTIAASPATVAERRHVQPRRHDHQPGHLAGRVHAAHRRHLRSVDALRAGHVRRQADHGGQGDVMLVNSRPPRIRAAARPQSGFTLIELMVTMLIVTVGMLGLAKLQAASVAESSMSRTRALMTFQAESLAGMMRANKAFWSTTAGPFPSFTLSSAGAATQTQMTAPTSGDCLSPHVCTPAMLAYDDIVNGWAATFNNGTAATSAFPNATAKITCISSSGAGACAANPTVPNSYDIVLTWPEKFVAINRSTVNGNTNTATMVMHVQP